MTGIVRASLVLAFLLIVPRLLEQFEAPKAMSLWVCAAAALGLAAGEALVRRRGRPTRRIPPASPLDLVVLAWLVSECISTALATSPRLALLGEHMQREGLATSLALGALYFASRRAHAGAGALGRAWRTLDVAQAAGAAACAYALVQAAGLDPLGWSRVSTYGARNELVRPFGTLGHPNLLGVASGALACIALARAVTRSDRRWLDVPAAIAFGSATLLTFSRGAWLGLGAGLAVAGALAARAGAGRPARTPKPAPGRQRRVAVVVGLGAVLLVAAFAAGGWGTLFRARFAELVSLRSGSGGSRVEIWRGALGAARARPLWGHGPDNFALVFPRYQTAEYWRREWGGIPYHAHDIYLHALATRGLVGLLCGAAFAVALALALRRLWRASPEARAFAAASVGAVVAAAAAGIVGALGIAVLLLLTVLAGATSGLLGAPSERPRAGRAPRALDLPSPPALVGAALAALLAALPAGFEMRSSRGVASARALLRVAPERALEAIRRTSRAAPRDGQVQLAHAEIALSAASLEPAPRPLLEEAEAAGRRAVGCEPERAEGHQRLGQVLAARAALGEADAVAADAAFDRASALAPQSGLVLVERSRADLVLGRPDAARRWAERAATLYPRDALAWAALAAAARTSGDVQAARAALDRALAADWHGRTLEEERARAWRVELGP